MVNLLLFKQKQRHIWCTQLINRWPPSSSGWWEIGETVSSFILLLFTLCCSGKLLWAILQMKCFILFGSLYYFKIWEHKEWLNEDVGLAYNLVGLAQHLKKKVTKNTIHDGIYRHPPQSSFALGFISSSFPSGFSHHYLTCCVTNFTRPF